ncbi:hypothetical protein LNJ05_09010 [Tenacibaculum finnmarkense genomovar ulcerans]|uniref:hypothetical protein n=1 Tax=Tenacibaculum finnmarkense TaxID=2781243 RepID=UPI0007391F0F|nr:hypothetical protein [Tenacibaculum finnmarkense]ALU74928.1 hypothetical protein AUW17_06470 [Tenacibaculum dicentrarchi]MBE7635004.1 hypothetical protein [Tenacibaculum finnmarkense genomovar ulcerans]MBE7646366.1 hypothetical protein [Tenacibaculum finnmarkense genomovar ulcerans]MCD8430916.1 hypothetical protein [Tenacibaculum finnmarkense genomovar ulcerans]MCD8432896.1 hypothetical protein [Tenacibaculum finnmarkense genomovar ulcerans]
MRYFFTFLVAFLVISCNSTDKQGDPERFKHGTFQIPGSNNYGKTTIVRTDSLQIEEYTKKTSISLADGSVSEKQEKHIDTLFIKWKNNFAYSLRMKSPKNDLDKDPIFVQITKVTDSSYSFTAKIGYSNFKQNGTVYKVN